MPFFNPQQQAALMAQMFQNPQGGGGMPPMPGQGGVGAAASNLAPSFDGPAGAPGVQTMPWNGQRPNFDMQPFSPTQSSGIVPLGAPSQNYSPRIDATAPQNQQGGFDPGPLPSDRQGKRDPGFDPGPMPSDRQGVRDPGFDPRQPSSEEEEEQRRRVLIEAIIKKAFGG